jgi:RNA polymerase sigma factor (sigma-70 family)
VMRIAHNLVIDHFRKNNCMPKFENKDDFNIFSVLHDGSLNVEGKMIKAQVENDVKKLIHELPDDQKEVLIMRIYKDMSFKEISEQTGVSINTALGRMRYALINLRKVIDKHNIVLTN